MPDLRTHERRSEAVDAENNTGHRDTELEQLNQTGFNAPKILKILRSFLGKASQRELTPEQGMDITVSKNDAGYSIISGTKFTKYHYEFDLKGNLNDRSTEWPLGICSLLDKVPSISALTRVLNHLSESA